MALQTEVWARDIAANLFPKNTFLARAKDDSMWVENKTVHLPQSGSLPAVSRNRSSYPATISQRTDVEVTYSLYELTSDPTHIPDVDAIEVSYDKRMSVLNEHIEQVRRKAADVLLWQWCPTLAAAAGQVIASTGSNRLTNAAGGTGNRKALTRAEVLAAKKLLDIQEIPQEGRVLLLDGAMYADLLADTTITNRDWVTANSLQSGVIAQLFGFDVMIRSRLGRFSDTTFTSGVLTAGTVKDPDAANAATDDAFSLAWHPDFVRRALGEVKVYSDVDKPEYYGSVFSTMNRVGGSKSYTDYRGIVALVETT